MKRLAALGLSMMCLGGWAADAVQPTGIYVEASGGYGRILSPDTYMNGESGSYSLGGFTWGGAIGYSYAMNPHWGVGAEFGYDNNVSDNSHYSGSGSAQDTGSFKVSSSQFNLLATTSYLWPCGFNVFTKAGFAVITQHGSTTGPVIMGAYTKSTNSMDSSAWRPMLVLGTGYQLSPKANLFVEASYDFARSYSNFDYVGSGNNQNNDILSLYTLRVGVDYNFGG